MKLEVKTKLKRRTSRSLMFSAAAIIFVVAFVPNLFGADRGTNVIIFVGDGLRGGSVNATDAPTMDGLRKRGAQFPNSHSLYPTLTTANASAIATGHGLGDTADFGNSLFTGPPLAPPGGSQTPTPVVFIENDIVLRELDSRFDGNYLTEETLLAHARLHGYLTAAIGKLGPAAIQDATQNKDGASPGPRTIIIDDATGASNGVPLEPGVASALTDAGLPAQAPNRDNGHAHNSQESNGNSGDNAHAGTLAANVGQQRFFVDAMTKVVLPKFASSGKSFVIVYWSRDPDASQHNNGDSLNKLAPGINGPTSKAGIRNCDDNLAQILDALRALHLDGDTDVLITADHGFDTASRQQVSAAGAMTGSYAASLTYRDSKGRQDVNTGFLPPGFLAIDLAHALKMPLYDPDTIDPRSGIYERLPVSGAKPGDTARHPLFGNGLIGGTGRARPITDAEVVVAANGGSDLIYLPGNPGAGASLARRIVDFLLSQDYVSGVFANDAYGDIPGALKLSDINLIGRGRPKNSLPVPAIVVNFASFALDPANPTQTGVIVADGGLQQGQGNHGGFDRAATFNFMAAAGPDFKEKFLDPAPVGNADVPMTAAKLLGFDIPSRGALGGRVTDEALRDGPVVDSSSIQRGTTRSEESGGLRTVVNWQDFEGHRYFDAGGFPGRTLGLHP